MAELAHPMPARDGTAFGNPDEHLLSIVGRRAASYLQPAMVLLALLFWWAAPARLTGNPWTLVVATSCVTLAVLGLEFVCERYASWRMNRREFATDLFYVVLNATVISWASSLLAEAPLTALKQSLGSRRRGRCTCRSRSRSRSSSS